MNAMSFDSLLTKHSSSFKKGIFLYYHANR